MRHPDYEISAIFYDFIEHFIKVAFSVAHMDGFDAIRHPGGRLVERLKPAVALFFLDRPGLALCFAFSEFTGLFFLVKNPQWNGAVHADRDASMDSHAFVESVAPPKIRDSVVRAQLNLGRVLDQQNLFLLGDPR
jgi:hypothetical protein